MVLPAQNPQRQASLYPPRSRQLAEQQRRQTQQQPALPAFCHLRPPRLHLLGRKRLSIPSPPAQQLCFQQEQHRWAPPPLA